VCALQPRTRWLDLENKKGEHMTQEDIQKAWNLLSQHNSELMLENEELKKQLMRRSLWYAIKRTVRIWRGKE
jgi:regulator of replication initiation timing